MSPSKPSRAVQQARQRLLDAIYTLTTTSDGDSELWLKADDTMRRALAAFIRAIRREARSK